MNGTFSYWSRRLKELNIPPEEFIGVILHWIDSGETYPVDERASD